MSKAADDLTKWSPTKVGASEKWRDQLPKLLKNIDAKIWKSNLPKAQKELIDECDTVLADQKQFESLLKAFHEDVKSRLAAIRADVERVVTGKLDAGAAFPIVKKSKDAAREVIADLADPLEGILAKGAKAFQGNREDIATEAAIKAAAKVNASVPEAKLLELVKSYKAKRKAIIDGQNAITQAHTFKLKTYRDRALNLLKTIDDIQLINQTDRDDAKAVIADRLEKAENAVSEDSKSNFIKPDSQLKILLDFARDLKSAKDPESRRTLFEEKAKGGKMWIDGKASTVVKAYNEWKVKEKQVDNIMLECKKLGNKTLLDRAKKLKKLSNKNKEEGQKFKEALKTVLLAWQQVEAEAKNTV